ncbi:MAG: outer membrane beta-barrel protein [Verrucomicrobia bacterium]|nr:outer membrane beta-barrel protein [Verrucomicrobiota bacterium]
MKFNKLTVGLLATGVVSLGSVAMADESPISSLVSGTTIGGAVDTSGQWKTGSGSTMANRFINTAPDHYNGINLEFFEFRIEKPLDEGQWSAGYKAEMWFGQDANALPGSLSEGVAVKQAYVALRAPIGNGLDFKIGQFDPIIGYEVASSYANPNFSRAMGFWIEPYSHTGALASYQVTEWLGVVGGVADTAFGVMNTKQPWSWAPGTPATTGNPKGDGILTYMGALSLKAPESWGWLAGSSLYGGIVDGGLSGSTDSVNYYVGLSMPTPIKEVTVGAAWDYISDGYGEGSWGQAIAGYISWQITEKLKATSRVEFANSNTQIWITPVDDPSYQGGAEEIFAVTATLDYALWANVVSRIEMIWDHDLKGNEAFNQSNNAILLVAEIAYKF